MGMIHREKGMICYILGEKVMRKTPVLNRKLATAYE